MMHCEECIAGDIFETVDCEQGIARYWYCKVLVTQNCKRCIALVLELLHKLDRL